MKRKVEHELQRWLENPNRKPLLLRGIRQSGKTYLLKQLFASSFPATHYFDLKMNNTACEAFMSGNLDPEHILQELEFIAGTTIDLSRDLLILDEIQS
ncbi:MAG: AAA family ATPase, partial [Candidatus Fermentibacteria bacterium]|nr:AAA family ATPase [Candidatus Fermentibacteria bacterium]